MGAGLQEQLEARPAGRTLISGFIAATLIAIVCTSLPDSWLRRQGTEVVGPYLELTGLDQNWRVFAPAPRRTSLRLMARVRFTDGAVAVWRPPEGGDLVGTYWDYRWRKWLENVTQDPRRDYLHRAAAPYIARQVRRGNATPTVVTLIEERQDHREPGASPSAGPWRRRVLYSAPVDVSASSDSTG